MTKFQKKVIEESIKMVSFSKSSLEKSFKELQKILEEAKEFDSTEEYQNAKKVFDECSTTLGKE